MRPDPRVRPARRAALLALALLTLGAGPALAQDPAALLESGRQAYEAGEFEQSRNDLWAYLDATASVSGPSRLPQADALYMIALMEPDASMAARHYETILDDYPAASVADLALFRLAQFDLVTGDPERARERLGDLRRGYPFSRVQPELPLWIGRTHLAQGETRPALDAFMDGLTRVKSQDLPIEMSGSAREALAAEYAWWLASAYAASGDQATAGQYYTMLVLDYPGSPQSAEARQAMEGGRPPDLATAAVRRPAVEPPADRPVREEPVFEPEPEPVVVERDPEPVASDPELDLEPVRRDPEPEPVVVEREPVRETPPVRESPPPARESPTVVVDDPAKFPTPGSTQRVWIQVGAFSSATNAADLSKSLKADGFDTRVQVAIVDGRGFYRVQVGPYVQPADRARVQATRDRLNSLGYIPREVLDED